MNPLRPMHGIVFASYLLAFGWTPMAMAEVYKVIGADGKVSYRDTPPASQNTSNTSTMKGVSTGPASADVAPKLRRGLWEFKRTFVINDVPKSITTQNCTNPISTMSFWQKTMTKVGCTYGETRRSGQRYSQTSACKIDAIAMDRHYIKVLEVSSEEKYVLKETATGGSQPDMSSVTQANRVGDC